MHVLFSLPVHERNDIVRLTIANAQQHVPGCTIALHVSQMFKDFDWSIADIPGVITQPVQHPTKHGFNQLGLHLGSHAHAVACGIDYDVFCILHTSEMFVKQGLLEHIGDHTHSLWYDRWSMPRGMAWHPMRIATGMNLFGNLLTDHSWYIGSILEGMWISRSIMCEIYAWTSKVAAAMHNTSVDWTLEEVALPTLTHWFGQGQSCGEPYNAFFDKAFIEIPDVDKVVRNEPVELWAKNCWNSSGVPIVSDGATKFSVKRLARDINDPVRQHIIRLTGLDIHAILKA